MIIKYGMTIIVLITPENPYYEDYREHISYQLTWLINTRIGNVN